MESKPLSVRAAIAAGVLPPDRDGKPKLRATDLGMIVDVVPNYDTDDSAALDLLKAWKKAGPNRSYLISAIGELNACELVEEGHRIAFLIQPTHALAICQALVATREGGHG